MHINSGNNGRTTSDARLGQSGQSYLRGLGGIGALSEASTNASGKGHEKGVRGVREGHIERDRRANMEGGEGREDNTPALVGGWDGDLDR